MKNRYIWLVIALCFVSAAFGFGVCRKIYRDNNTIEEMKDVVVSADKEQMINPSTKIVYEYYYPEDGVTEVYEDSPPYFLIDYTLEDLKRIYPNWTIGSFSSEEVVMKKNISGPSNQRYIIGEKDGYITVFYDIENEEKYIKELTDKPISSLSESDREKIENGIHVIGNERLYRALEDYTS